MTTVKSTSVQTLIIGAGFSGIGMAKTLHKRGMTDFLVLEESSTPGGTWFLNRYPGCACDIPTEFYSFSDEPHPWKQLYSSWDEIGTYLIEVVDRHNLRPYIRFGESVESAEWDNDKKNWRVLTTSGSCYDAQFVVSGIGALNIPQIPQFEDFDKFEGVALHTARWENVDLTNKRVAVVGTGASAIQLVPEIIDDVAELHLYQRTPPWVVPNFNWHYGRLTRFVLENVPGARRSLRYNVFWIQEFLGIGMTRQPYVLKALEKLGRWNINRSIDDENLQRQLTPNWTLACKRLLKSNGWYPAIANPKTQLINDGIKRFTPKSIVSADGTERDVDIVIWATGFHVADPNVFPRIQGINDVELTKRWKNEGVQAHRGVTVADMPNLFFLLGPNTGLGHNSVVFMIESQIGYVMQLIDETIKRNCKTVVPKRKAQDSWNEWVQEKLQGTVWDVGGCNSWYTDEHGVNRVLYPRLASEYWLQMRRINTREFNFKEL